MIEGSSVAAGIHGDDPGASPYLFFRVDDIDAALLSVRELGGVVEVHDSEDSAESVARFGRFALCRDDQSSRFGLHQTPPKPQGGAHAELVAIADEWARAIVSNDAARIASFTTDDWVIVSDSGVTSREKFMSFVSSGELTHSAMDRVGDARTRTYGDLAILTARVTNTAHYNGHRFDADEWTTDVFVRRNGRWLCVLSQVTAAAPT